MLRLITGLCLMAALTASALAQDAPAGIKRTPLQKIEFPDGYFTVLGLAELAPGAAAGPHTHPGIETGLILEGEVLMTIDGQADQRLKAGDSYVVPAGTKHDVKTVGDKPTKVVATYVVDKGKPLASPAP